jgi:hypothetical protein
MITMCAFYLQLRGLESHIAFALQQHSHDMYTWAPHHERNLNVTTWPIEMIRSAPQQRLVHGQTKNNSF